MAGRSAADPPPFHGFPDEAFEFYEGLRADNSRTYWTAHKHLYESAVRAPMHALLEQVAPAFGASATLFRPYRDVRFSADKSPYKTEQGAFVDIASGVGYWIQLDADGVMVGGGFHAHDRAQVARYRAAVDDDHIGAQLVTIMAKLARAGYHAGGASVRTRPRGVPADHPRLDLMRHESLTAARHIDHETSAAPSLATVLAADWRRIKPLVDWSLRHAQPS